MTRCFQRFASCYLDCLRALSLCSKLCSGCKVGSSVAPLRLLCSQDQSVSRKATLPDGKRKSLPASCLFSAGMLMLWMMSVPTGALGQTLSPIPIPKTKIVLPLTVDRGAPSTTVNQPTPEENPPLKSTGWRPNRKAADSFAAQMVPLYGDQIQNLVDMRDDRDALNWRFLGAVMGLRAREQIPSADQDGVGSCVGYGTARAGNVVAAADILHRRERERFVPWNPDAVYAIGRQRANQLGNWDGSSGSWSIAGIQHIGTLHCLAYEGNDLSKSTPQDGKRWAARGLPQELLRLAGEHKVSAAFRVERAEQFQAALQNGYAGIVCANIGYTSTRDAQGFARQRGQWAHCMAIIAYRGKGSGREGFLVSNSWGDDWISGPVWPEDQPHGSFWITPQDLTRHLAEGDSWVIAGYAGFEQRDPDWLEVINEIGGGRKSDGRNVIPVYSVGRLTRSNFGFALAP